MGHSSLRTGDRYSHTDEELAFRRAAAGQVGLGGIVAPADAGAKTDADVRANRAKSGEAAEGIAAAVTDSKQVA